MIEQVLAALSHRTEQGSERVITVLPEAEITTGTAGVEIRFVLRQHLRVVRMILFITGACPSRGHPPGLSRLGIGDLGSGLRWRKSAYGPGLSVG